MLAHARQDEIRRTGDIRNVVGFKPAAESGAVGANGLRILADLCIIAYGNARAHQGERVYRKRILAPLQRVNELGVGKEAANAQRRQAKGF